MGNSEHNNSNPHRDDAGQSLARITILPRLIRFRDAPAYLGMDRNKFNADVRPTLTEIPLGKQAIAFDRLELDAWVEDTKARCGCSQAHRRNSLCRDELQASSDEAIAASGPSTNASRDMDDFTRALEQVTSKKRKGT